MTVVLKIWMFQLTPFKHLLTLIKLASSIQFFPQLKTSLWVRISWESCHRFLSKDTDKTQFNNQSYFLSLTTSQCWSIVNVPSIERKFYSLMCRSKNTLILLNSRLEGTKTLVKWTAESNIFNKNNRIITAFISLNWKKRKKHLAIKTQNKK